MVRKLHVDRRTAWGNSVERIFHGNDNWQSVADVRRKFARRHALCVEFRRATRVVSARNCVFRMFMMYGRIYIRISIMQKEYYSNFSYLKWDLKRVTFVYLLKVCILKCLYLFDIECSNLNFSQYFLTLYKFFYILSQNSLKKKVLIKYFIS